MKEAFINDDEKQRSMRLMALGALGVVFGDIGTSPLYAIKDSFSRGFEPTPAHVLGILSLIFWALIIVVSLKYVFIVMRASNRGEGGILALTSLASGGARRVCHRTSAIAMIGFFGAGLFFGDTIITPAISVLSAVEGLTVVAPALDVAVVPLSILILFGLFLYQRNGTKKVGDLFGPVMLVWFLVIGFFGAKEIIVEPGVWRALNPRYALHVLQNDIRTTLFIMGSVVLSFTGAEALYADMGHFGREPIRRVWFFLVLPALLLNYFGQGALLLASPAVAINPFYLLVPQGMIFPTVILSTIATVIASQAVITGAFSVAQQAIHLGYLPRFIIKHTSATEVGQIYLPRINWLLCCGVILLVLMFKSSVALANAYGLSVMGTMLCTTLLVFGVAQHVWHWSVAKVLAILTPLLALDVAFFCTGIVKIPEGGWLPLAIGLVLFTVFLTWHQGSQIVLARRKAQAQKLEPFIDAVAKADVFRVPGTGVYLSTLRSVVPQILLNNLRHNKVLHERVIILSVRNEEDPHVPEENRLTVKKLSHGFWQVNLHYGFMERPNVMHDLETYLLADCPIDAEETSFFVGRDIFIPSSEPMRPLWREKLFLYLSNNAANASHYFRIPPERVVQLGIQIEV